MGETTTRRTWASINDYYADGKIGDRRKHSREVDFGVWWREGHGHGPWWRVSWVDATGELYAFCVTRNAEYSDQVELLAEGLSERAVEAKLEGWGEVCGQPESLSWVRAQVAS